MTHQPGSHRAIIIVDFSVQKFRDTLRAAVHHHVQAVIAPPDSVYQSRRLIKRQAQGVQVSVNINYDLHLLETHTDPIDENAQHGHVNMDRGVFRLNLDIGDPISDPVGETDQNNPENLSDEEAHATPNSPLANLVQYLPILNPVFLPEGSRNCAVCREPFPDSYLRGPDKPILLYCFHTMGRACLSRWVKYHNSCPICRTPIFGPVVLDTPANHENFRLHRTYHTEPWNVPSDDIDKLADKESTASEATIEDNGARLAEQKTLSVPANKELSDAGGSRQCSKEELRTQLRPLEREMSQQYVTMAQILANIQEAEIQAAMAVFARDTTGLIRRIVVLSMRIKNARD